MNDVKAHSIRQRMKCIGLLSNFHNFIKHGVIIIAVKIIVIFGVIFGNTECENSFTSPPVIDAVDFVISYPSRDAANCLFHLLPNSFFFNIKYLQKT